VRPPFAFLDEITSPKDFTLADVKARFGGGEFLMRAWLKGHAGFLMNDRFAIEGEPIPVQITATQARPASPQIVQTPAGPVILPIAGAAGSDAALASVITQGFSQLGQLIQQSAQPRGHGLAGIEETLRLVTLVKALMGGGAGENALGMVTQIMGIMREAQPLTGENGKADAWSLLQTAVEKILPAIIERSGQTIALPPEIAAALPAAIPATAPAPAPAPVAPFSMAELAVKSQSSQPSTPLNGGTMPKPGSAAALYVAAYGPVLLQAARANQSTGEHAQTIIDALDMNPAAEIEFRALVARPDWLAEVGRLVPGAEAFPGWFNALARQVIAGLDAPPVEIDDGDGDDLTGDEGEGISEGLPPR
jgi:hypothetical protein